MLINYIPGEECRISIVEDGVLEEFYQERASTESHVSNIYKGRVNNVEPSIQAAFIDFGLGQNGFLHVTDLHPKYFPGEDREAFEKVGSKTPRGERPPIQKCLRKGQEVIVQVLKEGIGTKGPTVTSYLSIPGRFLVMMPDMQRMGVSRKVDDDQTRRELRDLLKDLDPPKEFGFIIRTAGLEQTKTELKRDLAYLQRLWKNIETQRKRGGPTGLLYAESDLVIRTMRDVFTTDIERVVVDDLGAARRVQDFLTIASPRSRTKAHYYDDPVPLYHRFRVEGQIETINAREVALPSGGALVIDQTEALVAIDVNSGKSRDAKDAETNAYKTNLEAVDEICRQLRLRDLGGLLVLDLIDMGPVKNRRAVEQKMRANLKRDRARSKIGAISQFGMLEMTRQRMRPSLKKTQYTECRHCQGRGQTLSIESVVLTVMRRLMLAMQQEDVTRLELTISPDVAFQLLNRKRGELTHIERRFGKPVMVRVGGSSVDHLTIEAYSDRDGLISLDLESDKPKLKPPTRHTFRDPYDNSLPAEAEPNHTAIEDYARNLADDEADRQADGSQAEPTQDPEDAQSSIAAETDVTSEADGVNTAQTTQLGGPPSSQPKAEEDTDSETQGEDDNDRDDNAQPRRRRRRRRGGRRRRKSRSDDQNQDTSNSPPSTQDTSDPGQPQPQDQNQSDLAGSTDESVEVNGVAQAMVQNDSSDQDSEYSPSSDDQSGNGPKRRRRRGRRGGRGKRGSRSPQSSDRSDSSNADQPSDSESNDSGRQSDQNQANSPTESSGYNNRLIRPNQT